MKRIVFALIAMVVFVMCFTAQSCLEHTPTGTERNEAAARQTATNSATAVRIPELTHFQERKTIARWAEVFDVPDITCYIYIVSYGQILGYYVTNGKPASTQSYLTPGMQFAAGGSTASADKELPDVDGTYGDNPPGVRFFTTSGNAVEWAGYGATYIFSTQKLPLNVPEFGR